MGIAWLITGLSVILTVGVLLVGPRVWWTVGLGAALLSQLVIGSAWTDAKFGRLANGLLLAGVLYGFALHGPPSFRAEYRREVGHSMASPSPLVVTEADLAPLPEPVQH